MNDGKQFEKDFKNSFQNCQLKISIDRFYDGTSGYNIRNICDFVVFQSPYQYYFELKSYKGERLPFDCLTDTQYSGLKDKFLVHNVYSGVLFNFREYEETYFVSIADIYKRKLTGKKSINIDEVRKIGKLMPILKQSKASTLYDVKQLLQNIRSD